jgi:hypothetical protein
MLQNITANRIYVIMDIAYRLSSSSSSSMGRTDYLIIYFDHSKFVDSNVEDLRYYYVDNFLPISYLFIKKNVCLFDCLFFVQFHTVAPVLTKFGMMAKHLPGEVVDS